MKTVSTIFAALAVAGLSACGTTYELPKLDAAQNAKAAKLFSEARSGQPNNQLSAAAAQQRFHRVAKRISPIGKSVCERTTSDRTNFNCDVDIAIDHEMKERNAYFTYEKRNPIIRISLPLLKDTSTDDEVAFVLSHEYGHLIGRHIEKQQQQALAGALILGALTAAATAQSTPYGSTYDANAVSTSMDIGAAAGSMAYSQSYELESDTLGTRIAHAAGYDPVAGAQFFARPEKTKTENGKLSFWGTHPPDEKRVATVLATVDQIESKIALRRVGTRTATEEDTSEE